MHHAVAPSALVAHEIGRGDPAVIQEVDGHDRSTLVDAEMAREVVARSCRDDGDRSSDFCPDAGEQRDGPVAATRHDPGACFERRAGRLARVVRIARDVHVDASSREGVAELGEQASSTTVSGDRVHDRGPHLRGSRVHGGGW